MVDLTNKILYSCPFVPAEWIIAHGFAPSRIAPSGANTVLTGQPPGVCPYALAFANEVAADRDAAAVVFTTACEQMRRVADLVTGKSRSPIFVMNVPHTWQTPTARELYLSELERFGRFMVGLGGTEPSREDLENVMMEREEARSGTADARSNLTPRQYSELLMGLNENPAHPVNPVDSPPPGNSGAPVALVGGPLMSRDLDVFDMIESAGGFVALDATETGERTAPSAFNHEQMKNDPLGALADAYFGHIPDPFRRPNDGFYEWLIGKIAERGIRGIILRRYVWCDIWHAEVERIKERTGLPVLQIDVTDDGTDASRTQYRLQSFMEMLK